MALPDLFQQLVEENGWAIIANVQHPIGYDYVIENDGLRFSISDTKDANPLFSVGTERGNWQRMHPCSLVKRMGRETSDEFEAFCLITKDRVDAERQMYLFRLRKLFLEPALVFSAVPLLIFLIVPFFRRPVFRFLDWWIDGPVKRLVG